MGLSELLTLILLLSPIILIQFGLAVYALLDLRKRKQVHGQRWVWVVALILTCLALPSGLIVSALYLVWGRKPDLDVA